MVVVGHGLRRRQLRGPVRVGGSPREIEIVQRRFRCRACSSVLVVAPTHVLRYRLFSSVAITWALALYGVDRRSAAEVRHRINPWRVVGATAARGWQALRHWITAARVEALLPVRQALNGPPRSAAASLCFELAAMAPPAFRAESLAHQSVAGMAHALMGITP